MIVLHDYRAICMIDLYTGLTGMIGLHDGHAMPHIFLCRARSVLLLVGGEGAGNKTTEPGLQFLHVSYSYEK